MLAPGRRPAVPPPARHGRDRRRRQALAVSGLALWLGAAGCGGGGGGSNTPTTPQPACLNVAGQWQAQWIMPPCDGASGSPTATVTQTNCDIAVAVPGLGTFSGRISGNTRAGGNFVIAFDPAAPGNSACSGQGQSDLEPFTSTEMLFDTFGDSTPNCCRHGALTLRR